jgi:hypothetical protein
LNTKHTLIAELRRFVLLLHNQGQVTVERLTSQLRTPGVSISKRQVTCCGPAAEGGLGQRGRYRRTAHRRNGCGSALYSVLADRACRVYK